MHTVMIVEDDDKTAQRFAGVVDNHPTLSLLGCANTVAQIIELLDSGAPDVLLCDLGLPDGSGIEVIQHIRQKGYKTDILVISLFDDEHHVIRAIEAGANGYLLKDAYDADIGQSIVEVTRGCSPISPSIAKYLLKRFQPSTLNTFQEAENDAMPAPQQTPEPPELPYLTEKETEVLEYLAKGYTYNEISQVLGTSSHTVSSHTKHIYRKLEVRSIAEAVFEATQLGMLNIKKHAQ
jgi:DNA-binding NarL/FixJ family response regulator